MIEKYNIKTKKIEILNKTFTKGDITYITNKVSQEKFIELGLLDIIYTIKPNRDIYKNISPYYTVKDNICYINYKKEYKSLYDIKQLLLSINKQYFKEKLKRPTVKTDIGAVNGSLEDIFNIRNLKYLRGNLKRFRLANNKFVKIRNNKQIDYILQDIVKYRTELFELKWKYEKQILDSKDIKELIELKDRYAKSDI